MKNFKLFKRLGAFVTAVAVLASMGTVVFAAESGPTISITGANIAPEAVDASGEGVYKVTVEYDIEGTIGKKGLTMLAYAKANANAPELEADDPNSVENDFTVYNETNYKIAYIAQETPADSISFKIDTTGEDAIEVDKGEKVLILLGGDGVQSPASVLVSTYWEATDVAIKNGDADFDGFGTAIAVDLGEEETVGDALAKALKDYTLVITDGDNELEVAWDKATIAATETTPEEKAANDDATHKATITLDTDDHAYITESLTYEFFFSTYSTWAADTLTVTPENFTVYKDAVADSNEDTEITKVDILADIETKVKAATIKVAKTTPALEATVDAEDITVALNAEDAEFDFATAKAVKVDVTLAADGYFYNDVEITVAEPLVKTVTVNYGLTAPSEWTVESAEYIGTAISNIEEAQAAGYDFAAYAEAELDGKMVRLEDSSSNTYVLTLVSGDEGNFTASAVAGDPDGNDIATITVTVTIKADEITSGATTITIPAGITFNTTFTSKMETVKYGDVKEDGNINMQDAILIMQAYSGSASLTDKQTRAANVNGDGNVNMQDAILIMQRYSGSISSFPVEQ